MKHNLRAVKMSNNKIKPTLFTYRDFFNENSIDSFKDWFSGSKVIDSHGNPLRMYHGTRVKNNFSVFNTELRGAWFTADPRDAHAYAFDGNANIPKKYGRIIPVFLSIKNPFQFTEKTFDDMIGDWVNRNSYKKEMIKMKSDAIKGGFDGFLMKGSRREYDIYVAFYPDQIRSSITLNETN
jgi:hypothetical protein